MRMFVNPHTGQAMDFDTMSSYSTASHRPGKFCPVTNRPLDKQALDNTDYAGFSDASAKILRDEDTRVVLDVEKTVNA